MPQKITGKINTPMLAVRDSRHHNPQGKLDNSTTKRTPQSNDNFSEALDDTAPNAAVFGTATLSTVENRSVKIRQGCGN